MKKSKTKRTVMLLKTPKKSKLVLVNLKMTVTERKRLRAIAKKHAKGSVSGWLRHAAIDPRFLKSNRVRVSALRAA